MNDPLEFPEVTKYYIEQINGNIGQVCHIKLIGKEIQMLLIWGFETKLYFHPSKQQYCCYMNDIHNQLRLCYGYEFEWIKRVNKTDEILFKLELEDHVKDPNWFASDYGAINED